MLAELWYARMPHKKKQELFLRIEISHVYSGIYCVQRDESLKNSSYVNFHILEITHLNLKP